VVRLVLLAAVLVLLELAAAGAQPTEPAAETTAAIENPKPETTDVLVPMPCGLSMAFKTVAIPVQGLFNDLGLDMGGAGASDEGFIDRKHRSHLAAPLSLENLPETQRQAATESLGSKTAAQLYLIGKYEVTAGQWAAVMEGCQAADLKSAVPKVSVAWFDALAFTEKYMVWLLENSPKSLPSFPNDTKNVGIIRLPTESEWEYAARGGHKVSAEAFDRESFFSAGQDLTINDYANISGGPWEAGLKDIGLLQPSPLGLYDIAGNAAEMTIDAFRMTVAGRLHGAHGGFISKGGSYQDIDRDVLPGRRRELAYYDRQGPFKASDLGLRLVISALNVPGGTRLTQLRTEYQQLAQTDTAALVSDQSDQLPEHSPSELEASSQAAETDSAGGLDESKPDYRVRLAGARTTEDRLAILAGAVDSADHQKVLVAILEDVKASNQLRKTQLRAQIQSRLISVLYTAWSTRDTSLRLNLAENRIERFISWIALNEEQINYKTTTVRQREELNTEIIGYCHEIEELKQSLPNLERSMNSQFSYYKSELLELIGSEPEYTEELLRLLDLYSENKNQALGEIYKTYPQLYQIIGGSEASSRSLGRSFDIVAKDVGRVLRNRTGEVVLANLKIQRNQSADPLPPAEVPRVCTSAPGRSKN
jgi:hypothetical protein